jgi:hypothetical protein
LRRSSSRISGSFAHDFHELADLVAEQRLELRPIGVRVLEHVMQHGGRDDVIRAFGAFEVGSDVKRM